MSRAERIREEAARWFAKAHGGAFSDAQRASLDAWLSADPLHRAEYAALTRVWQAAASVPSARLRALAEPEAAGVGATLSGRRVANRWIALACVCVLAVSLGAMVLPAVNRSIQDMAAVSPTSPASEPGAESGAESAQAQEFSTRPGERRTVTLADGTAVELSTRTRIQVNYTPAQRSVTLLSGEAMFSVTHDAARPFVVDAGVGRVTVTGTRFDVRRVANGLAVAVESGAVRVEGAGARAPAGQAKTSALLTGGLGTTVDADGAVASPGPVNLSTALAWRDGKLVFQNATLADVVSEVSLYRRSPVVVANDAVGQLRVSSVFSADNTDDLLAALPQFLPVTVQTLADGSVKISSK
ncbi:FecR family protein [Pandoraea captiosa]|uniref:FecR family protein n=1 Tax=Pandoraea captiosa TaxID=2508302 RepID=A0A5E4ZLP6_9BURK|nr:FecR family protein [Pandoraea captiosa]VVE62074.1 FecR family protein [Pandoraea captiosa]